MPGSLSFDGVRESDWFELIAEWVPIAPLMADHNRDASAQGATLRDVGPL